MPNWPTPITLMDTSQNPPGVSCLIQLYAYSVVRVYKESSVDVVCVYFNVQRRVQ